MKPDKKENPDQLTIVGIGASAGGLGALKTFFKNVPKDSGLAYVVVVHLSPEHKSHMVDLLQPYTKIPVQQVTETTAIEKNTVYVIPPGSNLSAIDTHLRLSDIEHKRRKRAPIDHFFRTLAQIHDGHAVGVVLTGTGSDGTLGLREVKEKGGLTIVQNPNEAEFDGMPQSAISTGIIDHVLSLAKMPQVIIRYANTQPRITVPEDKKELDLEVQQTLQKIFAQIRARTGRDFSSYKPSTIMRRIRRRMQLAYIEELQAYLDMLREQPEEVKALADDLLITVTNFFRDAKVFAKLEKEVIPQLFEDKGAEDIIRVWSVGCATGEEAYSLAMLLVEESSRRESPPRLQIFASDLHERSLEKARTGIFSGDIETDVSPERLKRFFRLENGGYQIRKELRELVVFTPHNLLSDPPFSRLDLVVCRNVLIYLQRNIQKDVIALFHYALRSNGFLVLGSSERVDAESLFEVQDKKNCIYRRRDVPAPKLRLPVFPLRNALGKEILSNGDREETTVSYSNLHQRIMERYAPPSMLVSPDNNIMHLSDGAGRYLVHPGGEITNSAFKLVREELRIELRAALHQARDRQEPFRSKPIRVRFNGETKPVSLNVRPAKEASEEGFILVIFDETMPPEPAAEERPEASKVENPRILELENELALMRQRLQAIIEEYETSQEEMKASNEELQSANEELRSTMEELETSKEELQSMNEELRTVNQENRYKVEELDQLSSDLQNLLSATDIATLFLDRELCILRFTPKVSEIFNIRVSDRGRPISDLTHRLGYKDLEKDADIVLSKLVPTSREVQDETGHWFLTQVLPYRSAEHRIEGVVITFVDITQRKQMEEELRSSKIYAESIIETLHEPLLVLHPDLRVKSANPAFYESFKVDPQETQEQMIYELGNGQWDIPALRTLLEKVLPNNNIFNDFEVDHTFEDIGERIMLLNARRLDHVQLILLGIRDITEKKKSEKKEREYRENLEVALEAANMGVWDLDVTTGKATISLRHNQIFGHPEAVDSWGMEEFHKQLLPEDREKWDKAYKKAMETGTLDVEARIRLPDNSIRWIHDRGRTYFDEEGNLVRIAGVTVDITERKERAAGK